MMMQEENDLTQEMHMQIAYEVSVKVNAMYNAKLDLLANKILAERPEINEQHREYTEGVVDGLEWAVRIIRGDKSAS